MNKNGIDSWYDQSKTPDPKHDLASKIAQFVLVLILLSDNTCNSSYQKSSHIARESIWVQRSSYKILNSELLWKITGADIQVSSEVRVDNILAKAHLVLRPSWCSDILFIKGAQGYQNLTEFKRIHIIGQIHGLGLRVFA